MADTYRPKQFEVKAQQIPFTGYDDVRKVAVWMVDNGFEADDYLPIEDVDPQYIDNGRVLPEFGINYLVIETDDGSVMARPGDYVVRQGDSEFTVCKEWDFRDRYEAVA